MPGSAHFKLAIMIVSVSLYFPKSTGVLILDEVTTVGTVSKIAEIMGYPHPAVQVDFTNTDGDVMSQVFVGVPYMVKHKPLKK